MGWMTQEAILPESAPIRKGLIAVTKPDLALASVLIIQLDLNNSTQDIVEEEYYNRGNMLRLKGYNFKYGN